MDKRRMESAELEFLKNFFAPYTKRVYLVGGSVRDEILGIKSKEFDIEVYDIEPQKFDELMEKLGAKGVGKSFFVYNWKNFDISLPRVESKTGYGHRGFEVEITQNEREASRRRDFKMNALMKSIYTGEVLDFWGGIKDIEERVISHIDNEKFKEDSLRVLRAMQFASRLKFKVAKETVELCRSINLDDLSSDRVYKEFEKMFKSKFLYYGFYYFIQLGIAKKLFDLKFSCREFFQLAKLYRFNPIESFFLYHLRYLKKGFDFKKLSLPNRIKREVEIKKAPKIVTNRFLYGLSLRAPLKTFSILNLNCCSEWIKAENLWDKKYKPKNIDFKNPRKSILNEIRNYDIIYLKKWECR